jgi:hypothetical protein
MSNLTDTPPEAPTVRASERKGGCLPCRVRAPLARGRRYQFAGYPSGIKINHVAFRGHPEDDGGLPGVSVSWWGGIRRRGMFYPCRNDAEFWAIDIFSNAFDCPNETSAATGSERNDHE